MASVLSPPLGRISKNSSGTTVTHVSLQPTQVSVLSVPRSATMTMTSLMLNEAISSVIVEREVPNSVRYGIFHFRYHTIHLLDSTCVTVHIFISILFADAEVFWPN